jgi:hypothetical protein
MPKTRLPVELSDRPYRDVIWMPNGKIETAGRALCRDVLLHILGAKINRQTLITRYAKHLVVARTDVELPELS